jgi:hypothetical protein
MSTPAFEAFLARIYVEQETRDRFLADPKGEALRAGLTEEQATALAKIDQTGLRLAASSFERKRMSKKAGANRSWLQRLWNH